MNIGATSIGQIGLDLVVNQNQFTSQMNGITKLAKKAGATLAAAFGVKKLMDFSKKCLELGSDLAEVQNVVDVTFPAMTAQVDKFAKSAAASFGLSETMAKQYTGTFGAMAKAFGFTEKQAYDMSTTLTGLAGDVASFYNLSQDEAYTKLKSVFTGETESLKDLGVVMTQTALDSYALANGFGKTTSAMSEAEKVALRYQFVQEQLSAATGDFARTSGSWANQIKILQLQMQSFMATVGQGMINLFTPVIKVINVLISKLMILANAFKSFTELITGNKSGITTAADDAGASLGSASEAADSLSESTQGVGDAAKKAAKEMKALMGFDRINKLSSTSSDSSSSGSTGADVGSIDFGSLSTGKTVIDELNESVSGLTKRVKELRDLLKKGFVIGFGNSEKNIISLKKHLEGVKVSINEIINDSSLLSASNNLLNALALNIGKTAGSMGSVGVTIATNLIGGVDRYLSGSKDYIKRKLISIFNVSAEIANIGGNIATAIATMFSAVAGNNAKRISAALVGMFTDGFLGVASIALQFVRNILNVLTYPFVANADKIKETVDATLEPIAESFETLWDSVKETSLYAMEIYDQYIRPFFESLSDGFSEIVSKLLDWYNEYILPVLNKFGEKFSEVWKEHIQPFAEKFIELVGNIAECLQSFWENILQPFILWTIENILPILGPILEQVGGLFLDFLATAGDVCTGITEALSGLVEFFSGNFADDWEKSAEGIEHVGEGLQKALEAIFNFVKDDILSPFIDFFAGVFAKDWSEEFGKIGEFANGFFDGIELGWESVKTVFNGIITFITDIFTGDWESAWNTVTETFKNIFDKITGYAKGPINGIIGMINALIDKVNSFITQINKKLSFEIGFNLPNWMGEVVINTNIRQTFQRSILSHYLQTAVL